MAEELKSPGAADDGAPIGHNLTKIKKEGAVFIDRLKRLFDEKESANADYMADIGNVYEEMSNALGIPRSICREYFGDMRREEKRQGRLKGKAESERDAYEALEAAFGGLPMGDWASEQKEVEPPPAQKAAPKSTKKARGNGRSRAKS